MPIIEEPASLSGHQAGSFYRCQCGGCGTKCEPRALHNPATAKIAAESRNWLVGRLTTVGADTPALCPDCRTGPKFAA